MNNLVNVFDAIVGYEGAASVENYEDMNKAELVEQADGMAANCYEAVSSEEAERIANAVIAYRDADGSNDKFYIRAELDK